MTAISVKRNPKTGDQLTASLDEKTYVVNMQLTDSYTVKFGDGTATPLDAWTASDGTNFIPPIGSLYVVRGTPTILTCVNVVPRRDPGDPSVWRVQVMFKNIIPQPKDDQAKFNINIKVKPVTYEEVAAVDAKGKAFVNTNDDAFNPEEKTVHYDKDYCISFTTANAQSCLAAVDACEGHYNDDAVTMSVNGATRTFKKGTLLFVSPDYDTIKVQNPDPSVKPTWNFEYMLRYRPQQVDANTGQMIEGWLTQIANTGYRYKAGGKMINALDDVGIHHGQPVNLDKDGGKLAAGAKIFYLQFDKYGPASFTSLLNGIQ